MFFIVSPSVIYLNNIHYEIEIISLECLSIKCYILNVKLAKYGQVWSRMAEYDRVWD